MKKKQKKGKVIKAWPQNLSNKALLEEYEEVMVQLCGLESEEMDLRHEIKRRKIDPWE